MPKRCQPDQPCRDTVVPRVKFCCRYVREHSRELLGADAETLARRLGSTRDGLTASEAARRLRECGPNRVREHRRLTRARVLLSQIRNPLLLVLVFASMASAMTGEWVDAVIVFLIVLATVSIGYAREYRAETAAEALQARVRTRTRILRDGRAVTSVDTSKPAIDRHFKTGH